MNSSRGTLWNAAPADAAVTTVVHHSPEGYTHLTNGPAPVHAHANHSRD